MFVRLMVPTYLLAVGVASGPATVGAGYQLMLLLIYGTEKILLGVVLPLIYCYGLLTMINGIWVEEKLTLLTELLEKAVGWILKASLGVTNCTDHMGNAGMLLFRTAGTAMLLFLITLALLAIGSRGR